MVNCITKNLVMLMDGKIYVNSKENEGTTFTVDIPLLKKESETKIPDFENMGLNALVVDDEEEECRHAVRVLQEIKIQAEWVMHGAHNSGLASRFPNKIEFPDYTADVRRLRLRRRYRCRSPR